MTIICPECGCYDVELVDDNEAAYPQVRVEFYGCADCGWRFREVLTP